MIPKILHICWFSGDPYTPLVQKCIESWETILPGYRIVLWDKNSIDIESNLWLKQTLERKMYAFAADYIRFYALYTMGGIYLDSDVEVIRPFDDLLDRREFVGEEYGGDVEAAVIGSVPGNRWIKECLDYYSNRPFIKNDGTMDLRPVPLLVSEMAAKHNIEVLPYDCFSPKNYITGLISCSGSTYCIHHFDGKWLSKGTFYEIKKICHKALFYLFGRNGHNRLIKLFRSGRFN